MEPRKFTTKTNCLLDIKCKQKRKPADKNDEPESITFVNQFDDFTISNVDKEVDSKVALSQATSSFADDRTPVKERKNKDTLSTISSDLFEVHEQEETPKRSSDIKAKFSELLSLIQRTRTEGNDKFRNLYERLLNDYPKIDKISFKCLKFSSNASRYPLRDPSFKLIFNDIQTNLANLVHDIIKAELENSIKITDSSSLNMANFFLFHNCDFVPRHGLS